MLPFREPFELQEPRYIVSSIRQGQHTSSCLYVADYIGPALENSKRLSDMNKTLMYQDPHKTFDTPLMRKSLRRRSSAMQIHFQVLACL